MQKGIKVSYEGMVQDFAKSKQPGQFYYEANNIRIKSTDQSSGYAITNEHGNEKSFSLPIPVFDFVNKRIQYTNEQGVVKYLNYTNNGAVKSVEIEQDFVQTIFGVNSNKVSLTQELIGMEYTRNGVILFTSDSNGFDCIWEINDLNNSLPIDIELKYMRNMFLSKNNLIQAVYNYENSIIEKVYWVDSKNQLRFINLRQSLDNGDLEDLIDMSVSSIDSVGDYDISEPIVDSIISGGSHTAGTIQYAYNLYKINGSQTVISPLSQMISLDKGTGLGGGAVNEVVNAAPVVKINDLDSNYTHIKLYSIKYTSYNETPKISLLIDSEIDNYTTTTYYDLGTSISTLSLAEFIFLGSNPVIPNHIESKDSKMFLFNVKEDIFDIDIDTRVYGHNNAGVAKVWEDVSLNGSGVLIGTETTLSNTTYALPEKHDSINRDYEVYKYQSNGITLGYEGLYFKLEMERSTLPLNESVEYKFFKEREIYRIGIELYNKKGQKTNAKWMCDIQAPSGNLDKLYNKLVVELKPEFYVWLNDQSNFDTENDKPVGYRVIRAERTESDKTILFQGLLNPMVANYRHGTKVTNYPQVAALVDTDQGLKMPSMIRMFETQTPIVGCKNYHELAFPYMTSSGTGQLDRSKSAEGFKASAPSDFRAQTYQYNKLMQMFSPELLFNTVNVDSSNMLNIVGVQKYSTSRNWSTEYNPVTKLNHTSAKFYNGINLNTAGVTTTVITGDPAGLCDESFFGPTDSGDKLCQFNHTYREFNGGFIRNNGVKIYDIFGTPEVTQIGEDFRSYNGDSKLRYANHLLSMLLDDWNNSAGVNSGANVQIYGSNSYGNKCVTLAEGDDNTTTPISNRKSIEQIFQATGISSTKSILLTEIVKPDYVKYLGGIYGGNSYESRGRSSYIQVSKYNDISENIILIKSPGDTYVQNFNFEKLFKTDNDLGNRDLNQLTEIVNFPVETTIDLKNRNDLSLTDWDNKFHPKGVEYHEYNKVYSQEPTLIKNTNNGFKFKQIDEFDTKIIASKTKIPGEFIDNWTDFLENEVMFLDGKYGPINGVVNINDEIYTLQDQGVAHISINPRVQTSGSDGVAIQLGTGDVLHDYQYLSTESGSKNKWSIIKSANSFYYYDLLNKGIYKLNGNQVVNLSDAAGFHSFMNNNSNLDELIIDNPVLLTGVSSGYNSINKDVYMTFSQEGNNYTICYNEEKNSFVSFYDYKPAWYINKGQRMFTSSPGNNVIWEHFKGKRNHFYGTHYPSTVTLLVHPNPDGDVSFTNAEYKMEVNTLAGLDVPNKTFNKVKLWNNYQDTNEVDLILRRNTYRKFRSWKLQFPRAKYNGAISRDRMRSPWAFIKLNFDNTEGDKMITHDLNIIYNEH